MLQPLLTPPLAIIFPKTSGEMIANTQPPITIPADSFFNSYILFHLPDNFLSSLVPV